MNEALFVLKVFKIEDNCWRHTILTKTGVNNNFRCNFFLLFLYSWLLCVFFPLCFLSGVLLI